jgi:predicted nucleic acid-binding Zn ribbon protein
MVMPTYAFKCKKCGKITELIYSLSEVANFKGKEKVGYCVPNCGIKLLWEDIQIEFQGAINMNASEMGISQRKYNNKAGGPVGLSGGKPVGRAKI